MRQNKAMQTTVSIGRFGLALSQLLGLADRQSLWLRTRGAKIDEKLFTDLDSLDSLCRL